MSLFIISWASLRVSLVEFTLTDDLISPLIF